jgi:hypothetical protein
VKASHGHQRPIRGLGCAACAACVLCAIARGTGAQVVPSEPAIEHLHGGYENE